MAQCGHRDSAQRVDEGGHAADAGLVVSKARRPAARPGFSGGGLFAGLAGWPHHEAAGSGHVVAGVGRRLVGDVFCGLELEIGGTSGDSGCDRSWLAGLV